MFNTVLLQISYLDVADDFLHIASTLVTLAVGVVTMFRMFRNPKSTTDEKTEATHTFLSALQMVLVSIRQSIPGANRSAKSESSTPAPTERNPTTNA